MLKVQRVKAVKTFKKKHFHIENLREMRLDMGGLFWTGTGGRAAETTPQVRTREEARAARGARPRPRGAATLGRSARSEHSSGHCIG